MSSSNPHLLWVTVHLGEGGASSDEEVASLVAALNAEDFGQFESADHAPGSVRFAYRVSDELKARRAISKVLKQRFPGRGHSVGSNKVADSPSPAPSTKAYFSVEMPIQGDGFPSQKELELRNRITDELDRRKFGKFIGAGGGMGAMDFSYVVDDEALSRRVVAEVIGRYVPGGKFTIDASPADDSDLDDTDDDDEDGEINWPRLIGFLAILGIVAAFALWGLWTLLT